MDKATLRKVQLTQLEIAKDVVQICNEHGIKVFLDSGTLIGAIRHKGFIPWDDDLDLGMLRSDYVKFCTIAKTALKDKYYWQTWDNDSNYALPFGKVRKVGTTYLESRADKLRENGIWVDILPYDFAPNIDADRIPFRKRLVDLYSCILMKCRYTPWIVHDRVILKRRLHFAYYQIISLFKTREKLIEEYKKHVESVTDRKYVYQQTGKKYYPVEWFHDIVYVPFEDTNMPVISKYHEWLTEAYGDYMTPPPEDQRENQHDIIEIKFGDEDQMQDR